MTFTGPINTLDTGATPQSTDLLPTWQGAGASPYTRQVTIGDVLSALAVTQGATAVAGGNLASYSDTTGRVLQDSGVAASGLLPSIATIAALRLATTATLTQGQCYVLGYSAGADGGEGAFWHNASDSASADNGGTILVDASGRRWYREFEGNEVRATWFGCDWTGTADSTSNAQKALNLGLDVLFPMQRSGAAGAYKLTAALTMLAGQQIRGHGRGATIFSLTTASQFAFTLVNSALAQANVIIRDLTIQGAAATCGGIAFTLASETTIQNVQFLGCAGAAIKVDRGYYHVAQNCVSSPTASYKAGTFQYWSSIDTDYCYYPSLVNCNTHALDELGNTTGAISPCIYFRRVISGVIDNCKQERLEVPTANAVNAIIIENDSEGVQIVGGVSYGAATDITLQIGSGVSVAPGYATILGRNADKFGTYGFALVGSAAATAADIQIVGGNITAPASGAICIYVNYAQKVTISNVVMDDYTTSHYGTGLYVADNSILQVSDCVFSYLNTAFNFAGSDNSVFAHDNALTNCTTASTGFANLASTGSRVVNNAQLNPIAITTPAVPASATAIQNTLGTDVVAYLSGGTSVTAQVNGVDIGSSSGPFLLPANATISLAYSAAPTWVWVPL